MQLSSSFATLKSTYDASLAELNKQDELLQTLLTGMASKSAEDGAAQGGYMGQLADARSRLSAAGTEIEQSKLRISHLEKELKEKEPQARKAEKENAGLLKELATARYALVRMQGELSKLGWDETKEKDLLKSKADLSKQVAQLLEVRHRKNSNHNYD